MFIKAVSLSTIFDHQLNLILIFFIIKNSNEILTIKENISFENWSILKQMGKFLLIFPKDNKKQNSKLQTKFKLRKR